MKMQTVNKCKANTKTLYIGHACKIKLLFCTLESDSRTQGQEVEGQRPEFIRIVLLFLDELEGGRVRNTV